MRGLAILIGLSSCGRIGFDADAQPDARSTDVSNANDGSGDGLPSTCQDDARYVVVAGLTSTYRKVNLDVSWDAARTDCEADGAHLTIPDNATETDNDAIGDWVGLTDAAQEGTWRTIQGGVATFLPWQPGQPDGGASENCARLEDELLEDRACTDTRDYSCECE
jgi:hypothetical protein